MYDENEQLSHALMCPSTTITTLPYAQNEGNMNTSNYHYDRRNNLNCSNSEMLMQRVHDNQNALSIQLIRQTLSQYLCTSDNVVQDDNQYTTNVYDNNTLLISTLSVDVLSFLVNTLQ